MKFNFFGNKYLDLKPIDRKKYGTILEPNELSYEVLMKEKILIISDNIKDKEFFTCLNFVIKYLNNILGENFPYKKFYDLTQKEREKFNIDYNLSPIEDIFGRKDIFEESRKLKTNSIVIYIDKKAMRDIKEMITHIGFCIEINSELWVISKFSVGSLYLHKVNVVPDIFGRKEICYFVKNPEYEKYMGKLSRLLENRIVRMKEMSRKND